MTEAEVPSDSPYAFRRYLGPFSKVGPAQYMGTNLPRRGEPVYLHEVVLLPTNVMFRMPCGTISPIRIIWRLCLN